MMMEKKTMEEAARKFAPIFKEKDWKWGKADGTSYVPGELDILKAIEELSSHLGPNSKHISSGRLLVEDDRVVLIAESVTDRVAE